MQSNQTITYSPHRANAILPRRLSPPSRIRFSCLLQYNPFFVQQVMAMEARAQAVGAPPQYYMFPQNAGLSAEDAQRAIDAGLPIDRILPDLHVGASGAVEAAAALFDNPPVPGFFSGAINCETNADSHDHLRALQEAADLIDWFTADPAVTGRLYARTASFCTSTSSQFDYWDQVSGHFGAGSDTGLAGQMSSTMSM